MNFYIADTHFGHENAIRFDNRPFASVEQMDETLIKLWSAKVTEDDDVWILGDFCYRSRWDPMHYLRRLPGHKHLILGNHDGVLLKNKRAMAEFKTIDTMKHVTDGGKHICLCHYPLAEWNGSRYGSLHIYGHIHANTEAAYQYMASHYPDQAFNAGCMINGYAPVSLTELKENNKRFNNSNCGYWY